MNRRAFIKSCGVAFGALGSLPFIGRIFTQGQQIRRIAHIDTNNIQGLDEDLLIEQFRALEPQEQGVWVVEFGPRKYAITNYIRPGDPQYPLALKALEEQRKRQRDISGPTRANMLCGVPDARG